jgi:hypothetical protein
LRENFGAVVLGLFPRIGGVIKILPQGEIKMRREMIKKQQK